MPASAIDKSIFADAQITETTAIAAQLMQQVAAAPIGRRLLIEGAEGYAPRTAYDAEALSNPQLLALLRVAGKQVLGDSVKQALPVDDAMTAALGAVISLGSNIVTMAQRSTSPLGDTVPTALRVPSRRAKGQCQSARPSCSGTAAGIGQGPDDTGSDQHLPGSTTGLGSGDR